MSNLSWFEYWKSDIMGLFSVKDHVVLIDPSSLSATQ